MRLVFISDTHGLHDHVRVPPADVLVHAGDFTNDIGQKSLREFLIWFERQPAPVKILVGGNHDGALEKWPDLARAMIAEYSPSAIYLQDSGCEIDGVKFWGSPMTPTFFDWFFNRNRGAQIKRHWDMIPDDTDVLITHGPARDILDLTMDGTREGCGDLRDAVARVRPKVHVFGHFHGAQGSVVLNHVDGSITHCFNASICSEAYKPVNAPHQFTLETP